MRFRNCLATAAAAVALATSAGAGAETVYSFSGTCNDVPFVSNCSTIGLGNGDAVSGTLTAQTGFEADSLLTGGEIVGFSFQFGSVTIDSSDHGATGAYGVNADLSLFFLVGGMAFTGPGPDALTFTLLGADAWAVSGTRVRAGGLGGYTLTSQVPEPATLALLGFGLVGVGAARRLRKD